jgi:polyisoprenoid-binding protein YceI
MRLLSLRTVIAATDAADKAHRDRYARDVGAAIRRTAMPTVRRSSRRLAFALVIALLVSDRMMAQYTFTAGPGSRVILLGKSNVHRWSCATSMLIATASIRASERGSANVAGAPTIGLTVVVPVQSMNCGMARMTRDMFRALKADSFPTIRYMLISYAFTDTAAASDSFFVRSIGDLTVAGVTKRVEIPIRGERMTTGAMTGEGGVVILMTDFGIKPPTAFLGAIRARNALEIRLVMHVSGEDVQTFSLQSPTFR